MFDAKRLLDQFLGGGGVPGGFSGQVGQDNRGQQSQRGGGLDLSQIGNQLGGLGGLGGGAIAGSLATLLLTSKKGRKLGGSALQLGGMAVVGALAYRAYQNYQAGRQPAVSAGGVPALPAPEGTPFNPVAEVDQQRLGLNLMRAMIAAAKADGHVDAEEQANIFAQLDRLALDSEAKAFVIDELRAPLDVDAVARDVRTPEEAAEIYTASLLAIDVDNPAERGYLALLAARLKLDDALVQHLHITVEGATEPA